MTTRKQRFIIRPFPVPGKPDQESQALNVLRKAINTIFEQKSSSLSFEHLYRNAYNLVLNKKSEALYRMVEEALTDNIKSIGANAVFDAEDEILLPRLIETWKTVRWTVKSVANVLMYLDRTYINERHSDNLLPVFLLGITVFKNVVFMYPRVRDRFRDLVLEAISRERNGEVVDHTLLNGAAQMLVDMEDGKLGLYEQEFEREFLKMSEQYFHGLALKFLSMTVPEFLRKVEETLADEEMRLGTYLAETTRPKLMKLFNLEMLEVHAKAVIEMERTGFHDLVDSDKLQDLERMYRLFMRTPILSNTLAQAFDAKLLQDGDALVGDEELLKSPVDFVSRLLGLREKYSQLVTVAFHDNPSFQARARAAFQTFLNRDTKCSQCLALYVDDQLKSGLKGCSPEEVEMRLDQVIVIFRYLSDKDVFERFYKDHLQSRLLKGRSVSDEAERRMIALLKSECGVQFASKMEGMFKDLELSSNVMTRLRADPIYEQIPIEFDVKVLTRGFWPGGDPEPCVLPSTAQRAVSLFKSFFLKSHGGRRLTWAIDKGTATVRANCFKKRLDLQVSSYQMVILMAFNEDDTPSFGKLLEDTGIPEEDLRRHLLSLCTPKYRILNKKKGKDIQPEDTFTINNDFTSPRFVVKIPLVSARSAATKVVKSVPEEVEADRHIAIDAAVVRVMKTRKTLEHRQLVAEVTRQLSARFMPSPVVVKQRIENLIDRDYLERTEDRRTYRYVA